MNRIWIITILSASFILLGLLKSQQLKSFHPYIRAQPSLKIKNFTEARKGLTKSDQEVLKLWESILTGRSASLSKWTKETYSELGLRHIFTPSGFHLSAVLRPFLKLSSSAKFHLSMLTLIGITLYFLPGFGALKRMVLVKGAQKITDTRLGFMLALIIDILWGSFQISPVSFSYSFLFLGIIYSGVRGIGIVFWFFIGQIILAYFQGNMVSPLLLLWSPLLNFAFGLAMPLLFLLAFPLWGWQLQTGLFILSFIQKIILVAATCLAHFPVWEIHSGMLIIVFCFLFRRWKSLTLGILILSNSLNLETEKIPSAAVYDFHPQGEILHIKNDVIYFRDGKCKLKLVQGFWWEKCSPKRRSIRKKLKKLSYPSSGPGRSSLHGSHT